jgi:TonB family protein
MFYWKVTSSETGMPAQLGIALPSDPENVAGSLLLERNSQSTRIGAFMEFKGFQVSDARKIEPIYLGPEKNKSGRFMTLSVLLHAAMMASVSFMSMPHYEAPVMKDVVEFEVASDTTGAKAIPDGNPADASQGAAPEAPASSAKAPAVMAAPAPESIPVPPPPSVPAPVAKVAPAPAPKAAPVVKVAPPVVAAPPTVDDIKTPDLETSDSGEVAVNPLNDKDLEEDFEKVDIRHQKAVKDAQKALDEAAEKEAAATAAALAKAEKENQEKAKALAEAQEARRTEERKILVAARAAERAAAEKAAREASQKEAQEARLAAEQEAKANADREAKAAAAREAREAANREARESAAAAAAAAAANNTAKNGTGTGGEGEGTGNSGSPEPTKEVEGIPGGVRALDQLRQKPGNKFPQYDTQERLARQEGDVVFYAYVNKDGSLSQFKMGQSTGFRNLDSKTLAALKQWKFYPGQEGWVEMPYKWVLKGEAMEAGGQLRNKIR